MKTLFGIFFFANLFFMENKYDDLYQTWIFESTDTFGWQTDDYSFIKFSKNGTLEFLDLSGTVVSTYSFKIGEKISIFSPENKTVAEVVQLNPEQLIIEFNFEELATKKEIYIKHNFIPRKKTATTFSDEEVMGTIAKNKWGTRMHAIGEKVLDIEISPKNKASGGIQLIMIIQTGDRKSEMEMKANILSFDGTYFIDYEIPGMVGTTERFIVDTVTEEEIILKTKNVEGKYDLKRMVKI